ncbi:MAG: GNAT family N-acetyltransferase [Treponema sp.]|jgi:GNAT superfamily N-acetyltransferase|nr:GNAT family N-acetyltransferase [Treponema sp.]
MDFTIEELSMNAWPSIQTVVYDGWIIRLAKGYTKRANSVNPIYPSKIGLEEKIGYCEKLYAKYNLPAMYKLAECDEHRIIDRKLELLRYEIVDAVSVQVCEDIKVLEKNYSGIHIDSDFTEEWIDGFIACNAVKAEYIDTLKTMLKNITGNKIVVYKELDKEIAGCGYGVIENGYVGLFDVVVRENKRGNGYGKEIVQSILSGAGRAGVGRSYLQVVHTNARAKRLYQQIGYREKYTYWYRKL